MSDDAIRLTAPRPTPGPVAAVIFDWGGTLTPWRSIDLAEQWRIFARVIRGVPLDSDDVPPEDLARAEELAGRIHAVEDDAWRRGRSDLSSARLDDVLRAAGLDPAHDRHHLALAAYRRFWEPYTVTDPAVRPLWTALKERGVAIGVLSNTIWSRGYHRDVLARDGVLEFVDADIYSSEIHVVKPHAEAFTAALDALGVRATSAVYVGDRLYEDVLGAQEAGLRAIWVPHSDIPVDQQVNVDVTPDAVAHDLGDVLDIVTEWGIVGSGAR